MLKGELLRRIAALEARLSLADLQATPPLHYDPIAGVGATLSLDETVETHTAVALDTITAASTTITTLTTLLGAIDAAQTLVPVFSIDVISQLYLPVAVKVGTEWMLVIDLSLGLMTVERGFQGTTPAAHANLAPVQLVEVKLGFGPVMITAGRQIASAPIAAAWAAGITYQPKDLRSWSGQNYRALVENLNVAPDGHPDTWEVATDWDLTATGRVERVYNFFATPVPEGAGVRLLREPVSGLLLVVETQAIVTLNADGTPDQDVAVGRAGTDINIATAAEPWSGTQPYQAGWAVELRYIAKQAGAGHALGETAYWIRQDGPEAPWRQTTAYTVGRLATRGGSAYVCILPHTNRVPPNATYWLATPDPDGVADQGLFEQTNTYALADSVLAGVYRALVPNLNLAPNATAPTVTVSVASPAVVGWTAHGLSAGSEVVFATTGALPTGLVADVTYFVIVAGLTANSFRISTVLAGAAVNTAGTQSGIHTARRWANITGHGLLVVNVPGAACNAFIRIPPGAEPDENGWILAYEDRWSEDAQAWEQIREVYTRDANS